METSQGFLNSDVMQWISENKGISALCFLYFIWPLPVLSGDVYIHIDYKAYLLWGLGGAGLLLSTTHRVLRKGRVLHGWFLLLLVLYVLNVGLSSYLSLAQKHSLLGGEAYRVGALSIWASIFLGHALSNQRIPLLELLYFQAVALACVALVVDGPSVLQGYRLKAPIFQANALGSCLAVGCIIGIYTPYKKSKWFTQPLLLVCVLFTQSRGTVVLLSLFVGIWLFSFRQVVWHSLKRLVKRTWFWSLPLLVVGVIGVGYLTQGFWSRLSIGGALPNSIFYRWELQKHGFKLLSILPWAGWGPDMIYEIFGAFFPLPYSIQQTLSEGTFIDSTHNVFLDKFLELGWFGGFAYMTLVGSAIVKGFRSQKYPGTRGLLMVVLFITIRHCWSVTTLELECLYWIGLFALFRTNVSTPLKESFAVGIEG